MSTRQECAGRMPKADKSGRQQCTRLPASKAAAAPWPCGPQTGAQQLSHTATYSHWQSAAHHRRQGASSTAGNAASEGGHTAKSTATAALSKPSQSHLHSSRPSTPAKRFRRWFHFSARKRGYHEMRKPLYHETAQIRQNAQKNPPMSRRVYNDIPRNPPTRRRSPLQPGEPAKSAAAQPR